MASAKGAENLRSASDILLVACVVFAALNVSDRLGVSLFVEQELALAAGLAVFSVFIGGLLDAATGTGWKVLDSLLALATLLSFGTVGALYPNLVQIAAAPPVWLVLLAALILLLLLEATRRAAGLAMAVLLVLLVCYCIFGHLFPDSWNTRFLKPERITAYLVFDTNALLGQALSIGIIVIGPFILLGEALNGTGAGAFFTRFGQLAFSGLTGGPAKAAVVSSALFGTVSGSAVSNVATVGVVTIPMMKSAGYPAPVAAAIEAVGSTGGQLMPPVMGATAFLMAEYLQLPYSTIMMAAVGPAALYYLALFLHVDLLARRQQLRSAMPPGGQDTMLRCLLDGWTFVVSLAFLGFAILQLNWRPESAALSTAAIVIAMAPLRGGRPKPVSLATIRDLLTRTGRGLSSIIVMLCAAGLVIGAINLSGLSFSSTQLLLAAVDGNFPLLLIVTAAAAIILGIPLPTTGVYVILVPLIAPALVASGLSPLQAHFYIMYFGVMSMITPPVALSALVAANIAGASFWATCFQSLRIGWSGYAVPVGIALTPGLLLMGDAGPAALVLAKSVAGIALLSIASAGFMISRVGLLGRVAAAVFGFLLFLPASNLPMGHAVHAFCVAATIAGACYQWLKIRSERKLDHAPARGT